MSKSQKHDREQSTRIQQRQQPEPKHYENIIHPSTLRLRFAEISRDLLAFLLHVKYYLVHKEHSGYICWVLILLRLIFKCYQSNACT